MDKIYRHKRYRRRDGTLKEIRIISWDYYPRKVSYEIVVLSVDVKTGRKERIYIRNFLETYREINSN